jgi:hypothetical protein
MLSKLVSVLCCAAAGPDVWVHLYAAGILQQLAGLSSSI